MGRNNAQGRRKWGTKHGGNDKDFWQLMKSERQIPTQCEPEHESIAES